MCGEKAYSLVMSGSLWGSPPRMRGKVYLPAYVFIIWGITPAYAGKRTWDFNERLFRRDHPRVCGEKNACWGVPQTPLGSPPRMRGKGLLQVFIPEPLRITPACAGKRINGRVNQQDERDHPRVCGEKGSSTFWSRNHSGSPPRMRGKVDDVPGGVLHRGITPACAGKSSGLADSCDLLGDHPRVCGEKPTSYCLPRHIMGSPPRMRGKEHVRLRQQHSPRITPAYAGKSRSQGSHTAPPGDHPRVCGEKSRYAVQSIVK